MIQTINLLSKSLKDTFFLMEKIARECFLEAELYLETEDGVANLSCPVTLGLPPMAYIMLYNPDQKDYITVLLPSGERIYTDREAPGKLTVSGSEKLIERVKRYVDSWEGIRKTLSYPVMQLLSSERTPEDLIRILFRYANKAGAQVFVSHQQTKGKLMRITSSWMIDAIEQPMDFLAKKDDEWALYHFDSGMVLQSSYWFFEAEGLLDQIQTTHKGGMTNG